MKISVDQEHIRVIDSVLSPEFCEHLISKFELCHAWHHRRSDYPSLWELDLWHLTNRTLTPMELITKSTHSVWDFTQDCDQLLNKVYAVVGDYKQQWDPYNSWPQDYSMEGFRIKAYRGSSGDQFPIHTDAGGRSMCSRFLGFLFYLNNSDAGTEFPQQNLLIEARQGRLCMFPPGLQWPHRGLEPQASDKYILSTYLNFI